MILVPQIQHPTATEYFFAEGCFITEWWNSTADTAVSLARVRVEPGVTTRWHRPRGVTERYPDLSRPVHAALQPDDLSRPRIRGLAGAGP